MGWLEELLGAEPLMALFITVALGYLVGKLTIGRFVLGGIAGTLLIGVLIGQFGIDLDSGIRSVFFALFIYAVGFQGGPQFFHALNRRSLNQLVSALLMTVVGLLCVLGAAFAFGLDRGTAAGLAAGGLTQSAIIGTAGGAIQKLDVSADLMKVMETNVAVGYAITYIFGSLGPILMITWFFPMVMKWDIRKEALALAERLAGGKSQLEPGQFNAVRPVVTRFYEVSATSDVVGKPVLEIDALLAGPAVEAIVRGDKTLEVQDKDVVQAGDHIAVSGKAEAMYAVADRIGTEIAVPSDFQLVEETREIVLTNRMLNRKPLGNVDKIKVEMKHGVFLTGVKRLGRDLPLLRDLELHTGDELQLVGTPTDLDRVQPRLGYKITAAAVTDFVSFGIGMAIGILLGMIEFKVAGVPVTIGTGGGCLLSGLVFGWLRSTHPRFAALPTGAVNFLRDFGLAVFVGAVGIAAGPQALVAIEQHGMALLFLGMAVTLIPQLVVFYASYYLLRIKNPIELLACVAGGRSANPAFAALLSKAGNATPVVAFTVTYAVANVFLTLWGPLIIGIVGKNPAP